VAIHSTTKKITSSSPTKMVSARTFIEPPPPSLRRQRWAQPMWYFPPPPVRGLLAPPPPAHGDAHLFRRSSNFRSARRMWFLVESVLLPSLRTMHGWPDSGSTSLGQEPPSIAFAGVFLLRTSCAR
jgi:hypothetical protein